MELEKSLDLTSPHPISVGSGWVFVGKRYVLAAFQWNSLDCVIRWHYICPALEGAPRIVGRSPFPKLSLDALLLEMAAVTIVPLAPLTRSGDASAQSLPVFASRT